MGYELIAHEAEGRMGYSLRSCPLPIIPLCLSRVIFFPSRLVRP